MGLTSRIVKRIPYPDRVEHTLDAALDRALSVEQPAVRRYVARVRRQHPEFTPAQVIEHLEDRYRKAVMGIGAASGAAAAIPGAGTAASLATAAGEISGFIAVSALYVLALAELHGLPVHDPLVRRALVLSVLVGDGSAAAVGAGRAAPNWARVLTSNSSKERLTGINSTLAGMLLRRAGTRQGALALGRALPLGIGAAVGVAGNAALAKGIVKNARTAFGRPPTQFPPHVVDA